MSEEEQNIINSTETEEVNPDLKWYAIRTFTGHEAKVKVTLEAEIKRLSLEKKITEIIIPQETVFEVRQGKRRT